MDTRRRAAKCGGVPAKKSVRGSPAAISWATHRHLTSSSSCLLDLAWPQLEALSHTPPFLQASSIPVVAHASPSEDQVGTQSVHPSGLCSTHPQARGDHPRLDAFPSQKELSACSSDSSTRRASRNAKDKSLVVVCQNCHTITRKLSMTTSSFTTSCKHHCSERKVCQKPRRT